MPDASSRAKIVPAGSPVAAMQTPATSRGFVSLFRIAIANSEALFCPVLYKPAIGHATAKAFDDVLELLCGLLPT